jgi:hypothetical protein
MLIEGWNSLYPPQHFPGVWANIENLVSDGSLISTEEVYIEIERKDDDLLEWCRGRRGIFLPLTEAVQDVASAILAELPTLIDARTGKSMADPFVVATARVTETIVITQEGPTGSGKRPKIPEACDFIGVDWMSLLDLIKVEGWRFA